ncbi:putative integral membrane protein [Clavibacter sepedonicus]|uniref:Integral membrane protein n=1 Tax=Clavibacter sepedonicus TaxID=31964 RepID=B0RHA3_CLASE|nr:putative integral membrane protein [Clavibacter sepedonicus]
MGYVQLHRHIRCILANDLLFALFAGVVAVTTEYSTLKSKSLVL